jgi:hypothetical protein
MTRFWKSLHHQNMVAYGKGGLTSVKPPDLGTVNIKTKLI